MEERLVSSSVLHSAELVKPTAQSTEYCHVQTFREAPGWSPEDFAREQIRGLVRQVFFSSAVNQVRQVVFCSAESGPDVGSICREVSEALALDTSGSVAVVSSDRPVLSHDQGEIGDEAAIAEENGTPLRQHAIRIRRNLWLVPQTDLASDGGVQGTPLSSRLCELRREFEYSIVQGPPAGESSEAAALGQSADGIVLVLAAHVTRRATALKIKEKLEAARVRLLGTVLSERRFPVPEAIYRRL
jgi:hypothetical protein